MATRRCETGQSNSEGDRVGKLLCPTKQPGLFEALEAKTLFANNFIRGDEAFVAQPFQTQLAKTRYDENEYVLKTYCS